MHRSIRLVKWDLSCGAIAEREACNLFSHLIDEKLDLRDVTHLVRFAIRYGLIDADS